MFLQKEVESIEKDGLVLTQESEQYRNLDRVWRHLSKNTNKNRPFVNLTTSAFPSVKEQSQILKELQEHRYFDSFVHNTSSNRWSCFSCAYPEKVRSLLRIDNANVPLLEGYLKEKRGRWRWFKRWQTKYFTLSSAALTCTNVEQTLNASSDSMALNKMIYPSIELQKIRAVKSLNRPRKKANLPKAFEVFTDDKRSYLLMANNQNKAEEWFHCLQIAVTQAQREQLKSTQTEQMTLTQSEFVRA